MYCGLRSNNSILAVIVVAILIGLCLNQLGEKTEPLRKLLKSGNKVIQLYLAFLIDKVGPVAIFCLIFRTFAIYGRKYLEPIAAYTVSAMLTVLVLVVTIYPIGVTLIGDAATNVIVNAKENELDKEMYNS